jgi:hypothetical protein
MPAPSEQSALYTNRHVQIIKSVRCLLLNGQNARSFSLCLPGFLSAAPIPQKEVPWVDFLYVSVDLMHFPTSRLSISFR